jgi:hypothetical protein
MISVILRVNLKFLISTLEKVVKIAQKLYKKLRNKHYSLYYMDPASLHDAAEKSTGYLL